MPPTGTDRRTINVVELNRYAPRPFVFTEVATCLCEAIRAAGHESNHLSNVVDPSACSIILGALPPELKDVDPGRVAIFNLEQLGSSSPLAGPAYRQWLRDWIVADYHSRNVALLRAENGPQQQVVELPIVPSPGLAVEAGEPVEKSVDVLFFGTPNARRDAVLEQLKAAGLTVETVAGAYAHELAPAVRRARVVLHVHFYESAYFPIARMLQPVACGVPVVCEDSVFSEQNDWSCSGMLFAPYGELVAACVRLLSSPQEQRERAQAAQHFARGIDFAGPLQRLLDAFDARAAATAAPAPPLADEDPDRPLSDEEIEAILAREASELPEAGIPVPEVPVVKREPGQGRYGRWVAWALIVFSLFTIVQSMRR